MSHPAVTVSFFPTRRSPCPISLGCSPGRSIKSVSDIFFFPLPVAATPSQKCRMEQDSSAGSAKSGLFQEGATKANGAQAVSVFAGFHTLQPLPAGTAVGNRGLREVSMCSYPIFPSWRCCRVRCRNTALKRGILVMAQS